MSRAASLAERTAAPSWVDGAPSDYAGREPARWPGWRGLIGWDVFLNNLAAGLAVVAVAGAWLAPVSLAPLFAPLLLLALVVLATDLALLVVDLGDATRFLHMLRVAKPQSPMSVGVWSLSALAALLMLAFVASFASAALAKAIGLAALAPACGVLVYKGVLFSCTSQPGLRDARWLSAHLASSGLALGAAAATWVAASLADARALAALRPVLALLVVVSAATLVPLWGNVRARARERYLDGVRGVLVAFVAGAGFAVPLVLLAVSPHAAAAFLAAVLVLVSGLVLRHAVVRLAEPVAPSHPSRVILRASS